MAIQIVNLPDLGEGVAEGEMVKWLVQVGDTVEADQPVAEIMTDKATVEVPTPYPGIIAELKVKEGDIVPIETPLLTLDTEAEAIIKNVHSSALQSPSPAAPIESLQTNVVIAASSQGGGLEVYPPAAELRTLATPSTRRLAREMQVDLNQIKGTGEAQRVTREDVIRAKNQGTSGALKTGIKAPLETPKTAYISPEGAQEERVPLRGIRRKIAQQMQMAKQVIPHFTLMDEANVTELVKLRTQAKIAAESQGIKVTYLPFVIKALMASCREFPMFNASIDDDKEEIVYKKDFNVGFAAETPNGLVVPVIKHADKKTILHISQEIMELAKKAREGKLKPEEMRGATITITNIGSIAGNYATPIINHPEVAILGMYKIQDKPILKDGKFRAAKVMNFTITADHRLIDGAVAAHFLSGFLKRIEHPSNLMLDMM